MNESTGTVYVVFREESGERSRLHYAQAAEVRATSAEQAIRSHVATLSDERKAGTYAATPKRSWTVQEVAVETQTRIVLNDAQARPRLVEQEGPDAETAELASAAAGETDPKPKSAKSA